MKLRILKWPTILLGTGGVLFGSLMLLKDWRFDTDAPAANFLPPVNQAEARAQDVEHLALFFTLERSWTDDSLAVAREQHSLLTSQAADMSDAEFDLAVARIVALAGNAHTKIREYNRAPFPTTQPPPESPDREWPEAPDVV